MKKTSMEFSRKAVIAGFACLTQYTKFLKQFSDIIDADVIKQPEFRWVTKVLQDHLNDYGRAPKFRGLRIALDEDRQLNDDEKEIIGVFLDEMQDDPPLKDDMFIYKERLEHFFRLCVVKDVLNQTKALLNDGDVPAAESLLLDMRLPKAFETEVTWMPDDIGQLFRTDPEENSRTIATPWAQLNEYLDGGLQPEQLGVIMAPSGYGKSMLLVHIGAFAWSCGKNVFHFSFENSRKQTQARYAGNMTNIPWKELLAMGEDNLAVRQLHEAQESIGAHISITKHIGSITTARTLDAEISNIAERFEVDPELIIVDYGDLMTAHMATKNDYERQGAIFAELRDLASSKEVPLWTATQTSKLGKTSKHIAVQHVAESWKKVMAADVIIGFSRPDKDNREYVEDDEQDDDGFLEILKIRSGDDNVPAIKVRTNFRVARLESDNPATKHQREDALVARLDERDERTKAARKHGNK